MSEIDALLRRGLEAHQSGRFDDAEVIYRQILRAEPQNPNALNLLGMVHHQQGRHAQAEEFLRAATALAPTVAGFQNNLGNILLAQRQLDGAEECYQRAIDLQPDYAEAHNNLGVVLLGQGKVDEAMAQLVKTINLKHDYPSARNNLGNALRAKSMYPEAIASYRDALAQKADYVEAHGNLAIALLAMGQSQAAITECEAALKLQPRETGAIITRGNALEKLGRMDDAIASYRDALKLAPHSQSLRFQLAALTGDESFTTTPSEVVRSLFDNYAETFDRHLLEKLKYRGPQLVVEALRANGMESGDVVADLGCGTGLCGVLLRPVARKIVGVDLSSRMIGQARQRKVYDELFVDEIVAFLSVRFGQFDALVSADVLIYVGDLRSFFAAAGQALKAGGLLAFSVEKHEGEGFALGVTRRFSHSIGYVRAALAGAGFRELHAGEDELRIEHGVGVPSWVVVAQREL